jgi:hypothetical protein
MSRRARRLGSGKSSDEAARGDPRQLDHPMQGSHPEGTDVSALDHVWSGTRQKATSLESALGVSERSRRSQSRPAVYLNERPHRAVGSYVSGDDSGVNWRAVEGYSEQVSDDLVAVCSNADAGTRNKKWLSCMSAQSPPEPSRRKSWRSDRARRGPAGRARTRALGTDCARISFLKAASSSARSGAQPL